MLKKLELNLVGSTLSRNSVVFKGVEFFLVTENFRTYLGLLRISCLQEFCLIDNKVCHLQQTTTWIMSAYSLTVDYY